MSLRLLTLIALIALCLPTRAQEEVRRLDGTPYAFTVEVDLAATPVKSQGASGTCWSFSTLSFLESELLRQGQGAYDLSEMYVVRKIYEAKAAHYLRFQGHARFSPGGTFHDVNHVLRDYGLMPQSAYSGRLVNPARHDHGELDGVLTAMVEALVAQGKPLSTRWRAALSGVLDAYLGELPETFTYEGETYTPRSFADELGVSADEYLEFASFTHHPYYEQFVLEIPDNWDHHRMYNLPLDELMEVMTYALENGYTVAWDGDVSEETFRHRPGLANVPDPAVAASREGEIPVELTVTPELRQVAFDDQRTTDDHLMHITGLAKAQDGSPFFLTKNSWGDSNACGGYLYLSEAYARYKTVHIMVHQDAVPKKILKKLTAE